jgi:hypothetical protein
MSPIKQSLKGYQAEISRAKPETSKDLVEEMQKKAKARADSWKQRLLADANSVLYTRAPAPTFQTRFSSRIIRALRACQLRCSLALSGGSATRGCPQAERTGVTSALPYHASDLQQERVDAENAAVLYRSRMYTFVHVSATQLPPHAHVFVSPGMQSTS